MRPAVLTQLEGRQAEARRNPIHSERTASILGVALGVSFTVCFVTGLLSHLIQHPRSWFTWPPRPAGLYRFTQGAHVLTGIAAVPLLLFKLYAVYPNFWAWPPVKNVRHAFERLTLLPLVAGSIFLLFSGVANIDLWYPLPFFFPAGHRAAAWITVGALAVHIGWKGSTARGALRRRPPTPEVIGAGLSRRAFVATAAAASALLVAVTAGQTVRPLSRWALLAPRRPNKGPQGLPVNKSAAAAGTTNAADPASYHLDIVDAGTTVASYTLADLKAFEQHSATLPIACVEGWSVNAAWRGVRLRDLLAKANLAGHGVRVESLQRGGRYRKSELTGDQADDHDTLLAMMVNGEELHADHGAPVRLIAPNRPGVMQTKWVAKLVVNR